MPVKLMFGSDPEMAATYTKDGELFVLPPFFLRTYRGVSFIPDPNENKHPEFLRGKDWKVIEDGAAFELTVKPSTDFREVFDRIQEATSHIRHEILEYFPGDCNPSISFLPAVSYEVNRWINEGEDFQMATQFGCDPQQDAFDTEREDCVLDASRHPWRYFGGHKHVSGSVKFMEDPHLAVKCQAITAGCAAVAFSDVPDLERVRTFKYGIPGSFRVQNYGADNPFGKEYQYGVEYRTISCRWADNWELAKKIHDWSVIGIRQLLETSLGAELVETLSPFAIRAILEADQSLAMEVLQEVEARI